MQHNNKQKKEQKKRYDFFDANRDKTIDFKDPEVLRRFISSQMKIAPRRRTGLTARNQRKVAKAIKHARQMGILPYIPA